MCGGGYEAEFSELGLEELFLVDVGGGAEGEVDDAVMLCGEVRLLSSLRRREVLDEAARSHRESVGERCAEGERQRKRGGEGVAMLASREMLGTGTLRETR